MFSLPLLEGMSPTNTEFPGGPEDKESSCNVGDLSSISGLGRSPGEENGNPLQYSWLEKSHQWSSLACYSPWGGKVSDTTERLHFQFSTNTCWTALFFPFSFLATLLFLFFFFLTKGGINSLVLSRCDPPSRSSGIVMGYQILKMTLEKRIWPSISPLEPSL